MSKLQDSDFIFMDIDTMLLPPVPDTPETRPGSGQWFTLHSQIKQTNKETNKKQTNKQTNKQTQ